MTATASEPLSSRQVRQLQRALSKYADPVLQTDIVSLGWVRPCKPSLADNVWILPLEWGYPLLPEQQQTILQDINQVLVELKLHALLQPQLQCKIKPRGQFASGLKRAPGVCNLFAVASGKGGVGKSTTAVQLALALKRLEARSGLLDADIYGPNQPHLLGQNAELRLQAEHQGKNFVPVMRHGIQTMSLGYLLDPDQPVVWRGPMVSGALQQLLSDTLWQSLDYLTIDMPPGTGDIQLTLAKKYPVTGAVIVTTPHAMALQDARRAIEMFLKVDIPILGVVENMSYHRCGHCQTRADIFGSAAGQQLADDYQVPFLAEIPISPACHILPSDAAESADAGSLTAVDVTQAADLHHRYLQAAQRIAAEIARQPLSQHAKFPPVVAGG